jgi:hypothetical protein
MLSSLETGSTSRECTDGESSHRLWCMSVMTVREKCDEKGRGKWKPLMANCPTQVKTGIGWAACPAAIIPCSG